MRAFSAALAAFGLLAAAHDASAGEAPPRAVVELFTSQGCSSCPPADAYLATLAERSDVLALSFHVDYWDYLGWKDTLALPEHTERQRAYAHQRGDGKVYTPQMVVNGDRDFVGSKRYAIDAALDRAELPLDVTITRTGGTLDIVIGQDRSALGYHVPETTVRLVVFDPAVTVEIEKGENAGRTFTYRNVVRSIQPIGMWKGEKLRISLPADEVLRAEDGRCAVIVQEVRRGGPGRILGAAVY
jgi:hypothetical protein